MSFVFVVTNAVKSGDVDRLGINCFICSTLPMPIGAELWGCGVVSIRFYLHEALQILNFYILPINSAGMKTNELIKEIKKLPVPKRIYVIEKTIQSIRIQDDRDTMLYAAEALLPDYNTDKELTVFTNLDFEDFYETK